MKMEKIEIDIADDRRFADVAFLMDKEQFLQNIYELRSILNLPIKDTDYSKWISVSRSNELPDTDFQQLVKWLGKQSDCKYVEFTDGRKKINPLLLLQKDYHKVLKKKYAITNVIDYFISFLRKRYKKNTNFKSVIRKALMFNRVTDDDYETTMLKLFPHTVAFNEDYEPDGEGHFAPPDYFGFALYFLPNTPKEEVMRVLKRDLPEMKEVMDRIEEERKSHTYNTKHVVTTIKDARRWYWLQKQGKEIQEIAKDELKNKSSDIDAVINLASTISKAINTYKKDLERL